jgi:hypothetical protein
MSKKVTGVNKKNASKKGKGFFGDLAKDVYRVGTKILTGGDVPKSNPFAVPELN